MFSGSRNAVEIPPPADVRAAGVSERWRVWASSPPSAAAPSWSGESRPRPPWKLAAAAAESPEAPASCPVTVWSRFWGLEWSENTNAHLWMEETNLFKVLSKGGVIKMIVVILRRRLEHWWVLLFWIQMFHTSCRMILDASRWLSSSFLSSSLSSSSAPPKPDLKPHQGVVSGRFCQSLTDGEPAHSSSDTASCPLPSSLLKLQFSGSVEQNQILVSLQSESESLKLRSSSLCFFEHLYKPAERGCVHEQPCFWPEEPPTDADKSKKRNGGNFRCFGF